jgi:F-type H+-transporting ATPase subunit epsilon
MRQPIPGAIALKIIAPQQLLVDVEASEVSLPGLDGQLGILPGHRPLITMLGRGDLSYRVDNAVEKFAVRGGYAEIRPDSVLVFTELSEDEPDQP